MSGRAPRILIVSAAGFTNLGDDAILAATLAELRTAIPGARFLVASGSADAAVADDVTPVEFTLGGLDTAASLADLAIVGGGGFLFDYDGRVSAHDFLRGDGTYFYPYLRAAILARKHGVPVYFYALGVGPLVTAAGRSLTRDVLSQAAAITVRDEVSRHELETADVLSPAAEVTADPAVSLPPASEPWAERPEGRVVGFVLRPWLRLGNEWTPSGRALFDRYAASIAGAADELVERLDATPVFLATQRLADDDLEVGERIAAAMRHGERARVLAGVVDFRMLQQVIGGLDALVSTRLHPLLLAAVAGVPPIGIANTPKVRTFLTAIGLREQVLSPWHSSRQRLVAAVRRGVDERERIAEVLANAVAAQRASAARNAAIAAELVAAS